MKPFGNASPESTKPLPARDSLLAEGVCTASLQSRLAAQDFNGETEFVPLDFFVCRIEVDFCVVGDSAYVIFRYVLDPWTRPDPNATVALTHTNPDHDLTKEAPGRGEVWIAAVVPLSGLFGISSHIQKTGATT